MAVKVEQGQCMADIAIQTTGSVEALFDLAIANNMMPDELPVPGVALATTSVLDQLVAGKYKQYGWQPASVYGEVIESGSGAFSSGFSLGFS